MKVVDLPPEEKKFLTREEFNKISLRARLDMDIKKLVDHVLLADEENDRLLSRISNLKETINLLSDKLEKLETYVENLKSNDSWITDF